MAGKTLPTWSEINAAATSQTLNMALWEDELPNRLVSYILSHTKSVERYYHDPVFYNEMNRLVGLVVGCILEHSPLVDPVLRQRAADFDAIFQQATQEGRPQE